MIIKQKHIIFVLITAFLAGCIDEYFPEIKNYENLLVVDGMITTKQGPYVIKLARSSSLQNPEVIPVEGANVIIRDNWGNEEILEELNEVLGREKFNRYVTSEESFL